MLPYLLEHGVTQEQVDVMLIDVPRRVLAGWLQATCDLRMSGRSPRCQECLGLLLMFY